VQDRPFISVWFGNEGDEKISLVFCPHSSPLAASEQERKGVKTIIRQMLVLSWVPAIDVSSILLKTSGDCSEIIDTQERHILLRPFDSIVCSGGPDSAPKLGVKR